MVRDLRRNFPVVLHLDSNQMRCDRGSFNPHESQRAETRWQSLRLKETISQYTHHDPYSLPIALIPTLFGARFPLEELPACRRNLVLLGTLLFLCGATTSILPVEPADFIAASKSLGALVIPNSRNRFRLYCLHSLNDAHSRA